VCGIAGFERKISTLPLNEFKPILKHRGPDNTGFFQDEHYSFIHWRLSIIDLSQSANQPFCFKNLVLVYNGEIYNHKEVAIELINQGYSFSTHSDTEVLIKGFHYWGPKVVDKLIGMFSFSVYNTDTKEIFLFRDRLGVKPMYYTTSKNFAFGSEMKFFRSLGLTLTIDQVALHQYFRFGYVPGMRTIFCEVKKLLPGQYLRFIGGVVECHTYWSIPKPKYDQVNLQNSHEYEQKLEELLISAFNYRLVADVPIGVFLSGGIDSSLLATLLQHHSGKQVKTFTIGFDDPAYDETIYAKKVANRLQTDHVELRLDVNRASTLFEQFYEIFDEPFSDTSGIPMALISQLAKEHGVKVVLSADGADEFFGGYPHYQRIGSWLSRLNKVPMSVRIGSSTLINGLLPQFLRSSLDFMNLEHRVNRAAELLSSRSDIEAFESAIANQTHRSIAMLLETSVHPFPLLNLDRGLPQEKMMYWDARYFLPDDLLMKVDRATMFNGIEGREPFLDHRVVEFAQHLPYANKVNGNIGKQVLREILNKYHPKELFARPKQGFSIPIFGWFSKNLDRYFDEFLHERKVSETGLLHPQVVKAELDKYKYYKQRGMDYNIEKMWRLLSFMMWHNRWMN